MYVHGTVSGVSVCVWCLLCWGISSAFWSLAISGSLQSPPPYVNKHDRSLCLNQHGGGGGSQWVGAGGRKHNQGVCVCGRLAGGQACPCRRERERGGAKGAAWPCHAGWPRGRTRGKEEGNWRPGLLSDKAGRPNGGGQAASGLRWGDRSQGTLSTVRPQLMSGVSPTRAWGPLGRLEWRDMGKEGLVMSCPVTLWWALGLCVCL